MDLNKVTINLLQQTNVFSQFQKGSFSQDNIDYVIEPVVHTSGRQRRSASGRHLYKISLAPVAGVDYKQDTGNA